MATHLGPIGATKRWASILAALRKYWFLYALFTPTLIIIIIFNFIPNIMTVPLVFKKYYLLNALLQTWTRYDTFGI